MVKVFYSVAEDLLVFISYACLSLLKESPKQEAGSGIYTPVQQLLRQLICSLLNRVNMCIGVNNRVS